MQDNNGWIKLHRKILDNPRVDCDNDYFTVWVKLLFYVTHKPKDVIFKRQRITLKPGQILTGRKWLASQCNISQTKLERILKDFENEQQIGQQTSNKNRIITVLNWDKYQNIGQQNGQQTDNKRTASGHIQECKNIKNERKNTDTAADAAGHEQIVEIFSAFKEVNPTLSYGNTTHRKAAADLITQFGFDKALNTARYAASIQGNRYAPTISNPYELKINLGKLLIYHKREGQPQKGGITVI